MIEIKDGTLKYLNGNGIFDINLKIRKGEVFGLVGPNESGKTTIARLLMGFCHPSKGSFRIGGFNCSSQTAPIQKLLGYVPEEASFFENMKIKEYLNFMGRLRGKESEKALQRKEILLEKFDLDQNERVEQLSNDARQKLSIVTAFIHDPSVYLLDEPTKYLDASMQGRFIDLMLEEKKAGKTIFVTSHVFEEVERICDTIAVLKNGKIIEKDNVINIKAKESKAYLVKFAAPPNIEELIRYGCKLRQFSEVDYEIYVKGDRIDLLTKLLSREKILVFNSITQTIEDSLRGHYRKEGK